MIRSGCPAISLLATCGSEPIDFLPPFGGRHGTRAKISLTLSTARAAMLLCAGLPWTPADVPAVGAWAGFAASDLAASDLAASDLAASDFGASALAPSASPTAACCANCARAKPGVSDQQAVSAAAASAART